MVDHARTSSLPQNPDYDNQGPFVFRRAPRLPVIDYDNDRDNLFGTINEDSYADSMTMALLFRPKMQATPASVVLDRHKAMLTHAEEVENMVEGMVSLMRRERTSKFSGKQDAKTRREKVFIAQMAARFAKEERDLIEQEDFYPLREPSEDPLPPLANTMENLMEPGVHIEDRRRRISAHEYRNSLVTSTTNPNLDDPSKSSLDNPIIDIAIDQFLTQDPGKLETLHQKLGRLCGIAMERAKKLGLEGVSEGESYILKHIRTLKPSPVTTYWTDHVGDDASMASIDGKDSMSKVEGKRPVEECADAAFARCQHHSCQPIQSRSRRSSSFSDTTFYGPLFKEPEASEDTAKSEEPSPGENPSFRDESLAKCIYMNVAYFDLENPVGSLLQPIARAVYELE